MYRRKKVRGHLLWFLIFWHLNGVVWQVVRMEQSLSSKFNCHVLMWLFAERHGFCLKQERSEMDTSTRKHFWIRLIVPSTFLKSAQINSRQGFFCLTMLPHTRNAQTMLFQLSECPRVQAKGGQIGRVEPRCDQHFCPMAKFKIYTIRKICQKITLITNRAAHRNRTIRFVRYGCTGKTHVPSSLQTCKLTAVIFTAVNRIDIVNFSRITASVRVYGCMVYN